MSAAIAIAIAFGNYRQKVGSVNRIVDCKPFCCQHCLTTATATVTNKIYALPYILAKLHKILSISLLQQV